MFHRHLLHIHHFDNRQVSPFTNDIDQSWSFFDLNPTMADVTTLDSNTEFSMTAGPYDPDVTTIIDADPTADVASSASDVTISETATTVGPQLTPSSATPSSTVMPVTMDSTLSASIAGAVIATIVIIVIVIAGIVAFYLIKRCQKKKKEESMTQFSEGAIYPAETTTPGNYQFSFLSNSPSFDLQPFEHGISTPAAVYTSTVGTSHDADRSETITRDMLAGEKNLEIPMHPLQHAQVQQSQYPSSTFKQEVWQQNPIGIYTVVATYTPTLNDEIEVQLGDQVHVYIEYDDGWCMGANLTRGYIRGVFPKFCVQEHGQEPGGPETADARRSTVGPPFLGHGFLGIDEKQPTKRGSSLYSTLRS